MIVPLSQTIKQIRHVSPRRACVHPVQILCRTGVVALPALLYRILMTDAVISSKALKSSLWRSEIIATLALAWPLILTNVSQMLINFTDVLMLARVGPDALAASALGTGITWSLMLFGIGLVAACSPMIASQRGKMPHSVRDVRRTVRQTMWAAVTIGVPIMVLLWFTGPLLRLAGQPERLATDTDIFVRALEWCMIPALLTVVLRNFMSALERPAWILIVGIGGVFVNALINWALIFGHFGLPALGLFGAGIGSSLTSLLVFLAMIVVAARHPKFRRYHVFGRFWRSDWPRYKAIWALGYPIALQLGFEATVFAAAVFLMGYIGTSSVAAHAVAIQIASMTFMVPMGIAQAATVRVGTALGRGDPVGIARAGWAAYGLGVGFMALMAVMMWVFPRALAEMFLDPTAAGNAKVIEIAMGFLSVAAVFQIVDGAQVVGAGMLRGLHDTKMPMVFAAFGYWVIGIGVGIYLAFGAGWDGLGIWVGLATGLAVVSMLMLIRWRDLLARKKAQMA
jgi:multidrug resistance protein, MATE family